MSMFNAIVDGVTSVLMDAKKKKAVAAKDMVVTLVGEWAEQGNDLGEQVGRRCLGLVEKYEKMLDERGYWATTLQQMKDTPENVLPLFTLGVIVGLDAKGFKVAKK